MRRHGWAASPSSRTMNDLRRQTGDVGATRAIVHNDDMHALADNSAASTPGRSAAVLVKRASGTVLVNINLDGARGTGRLTDYAGVLAASEENGRTTRNGSLTIRTKWKTNIGWHSRLDWGTHRLRTPCHRMR